MYMERFFNLLFRNFKEMLLVLTKSECFQVSSALLSNLNYYIYGK